MTDWRNITWIMLHTYTVKIKSDIVISNINDIKKFLRSLILWMALRFASLSLDLLIGSACAMTLTLYDS